MTMRIPPLLLLLGLAVLTGGCDWEIEEDPPGQYHELMGEYFLLERTVDGERDRVQIYQRYYGHNLVERLDRAVWFPYETSAEVTSFYWETTDAVYDLFDWVTRRQALSGEYRFTEDGLLVVEWMEADSTLVRETYLKKSSGANRRLAGFWLIDEAVRNNEPWGEMGHGQFAFNTTENEILRTVPTYSDPVRDRFFTHNDWLVIYDREITDLVRWHEIPWEYMVSADDADEDTLLLESWTQLNMLGPIMTTKIRLLPDPEH